MSHLTIESPAVPAVLPPDHGARGHHRFGMSKLNSIDPSLGGCRGYQGKDGTSQAAEDGTTLHEISERVVRAYLKAPRPVPSLCEFAAGMRTWDDDSDQLLRFAFRYLDSKFRSGTQVFVELKARIRRDDGTEINYGHLDLFLIDAQGDGYLIDWKFGYVPVTSADKNRQGQGYAAAMFQAFPAVRSITVVFVQPKLRWVTEHKYPRARANELAHTIEALIQQATAVQSVQPMDPANLNAGAACGYCARVATCPAYMRAFGSAVARMGELPLPSTFNLDAIDSPETAAIAHAWVDFLKLAVEPIKERAMAYAKANNGAISATLPDGQVIRYEIQRKGHDRVVGNAVQVAEALKDYIGPLQLLGAAKLGLGKLAELVSPNLREMTPELTTKKAAVEAMESLLESQGLLSRPDGEVEFLKRSKTVSKTAKIK